MPTSRRVSIWERAFTWSSRSVRPNCWPGSARLCGKSARVEPAPRSPPTPDRIIAHFDRARLIAPRQADPDRVQVKALVDFIPISRLERPAVMPAQAQVGPKTLKAVVPDQVAHRFSAVLVTYRVVKGEPQFFAQLPAPVEDPGDALVVEAGGKPVFRHVRARVDGAARVPAPRHAGNGLPDINVAKAEIMEIKVAEESIDEAIVDPGADAPLRKDVAGQGRSAVQVHDPIPVQPLRP